MVPAFPETLREMDAMAIRAVVWGENIHDRENAVVRGIYAKGMHGAIAEALNEDARIKATTATMEQPEHGLSDARLAETDVLTWWGHRDHGGVDDKIVERVAERVWQGMGLIVLHSGHFSKIFKKLMGAPCALKWREAGEKERVWVINRNHPIAAGLDPYFVIPQTEMYGEPFLVPEPMETVFISWYDGGEVFRSGLTFQRGGGRIFYFSPGHEVYPIYKDKNVRQVLRNAVKWAYNPASAWKDVSIAANTPIDKAPEPITEKGPKLHKVGEEGFR
jgi:trehalose utilization protein